MKPENHENNTTPVLDSVRKISNAQRFFDQALADQVGYTGFRSFRVSSLESLERWAVGRQANIVVLHFEQQDTAFWSNAISLIRNTSSKNPAVVLVSSVDSENTVLDALNSGADFFVSSSASITELSARIILAWKSQTQYSPRRSFPPFIFDIKARAVFNHGCLVRLTEMEYKLALYFFSHPFEILTRKRILSEVWGIHANMDTRRVDIHICRVRSQLGLSRQSSRWRIKAIYQVGYILESLDNKRPTH